MSVCPGCLAVQVNQAMEKLTAVMRSADGAGLGGVVQDLQFALNDLDDVCGQLMAAVDDGRCEHAEEAP